MSAGRRRATHPSSEGGAREFQWEFNGAICSSADEPPRSHCRRQPRQRGNVGYVVPDGGHEVLIVHDGRKATEAFATIQPEVALLDIGMPEIKATK